ncbi:MAG: PBP1A family penicillin-binding protein [Rickettsiales bacterium]|jgi:penicillin-binding protein 1A|nr:PBP1A family penicillin-binding protein [Rickettsiales bacterium]
MKALEKILRERGARLHSCGPRRRGMNPAPRHALLPFARGRGLFRAAFRVLSPIVMVGSLAVFGYLMIVLAQMPSLDAMLTETRTPAIIIVDKNGYEIRSVGRLMGDPITTKSVPPYVWQSIVATEDKRFFEHGAVDPHGLSRSVLKNIAAGRVVEGGSSISQQLAKNLFLGYKRTFSRKLQELILAFWLEERFSKEQILDLYMNRVSLVKGMRGIDAAARDLFMKTADELTLSESAMITAMLKAPTTYNPMRRPENAKRRAKIVLGALKDQKYISAADYDKALAQIENYKPAVRQDENIYRYFADFVIDDVQSRFGGNINSDMIVHTTLDSRLQQRASGILAKKIQASADKSVSQGAVVAMAEDGAILAMVGGVDYQASQFNRSIAPRQPGSAFKSVVYLVALEKGKLPTDIVVDEPFSIGDYNPKNYDERYYGSLSLSSAFAKSVNSVPLKLTQEFGLDNVLKMASRLGVGTKLRREYSTILGASEMTLVELTTMYAAIFNGGKSVIPYAVSFITDSYDNVIYSRIPSKPAQLLGAHTIAEMNIMLAEVVKSGTGRRAYVAGRTRGGKTGTSQNSRDAWFIGATDKMTIGVWVGNDDYTPTKNITGGTLPAEIFKAIVE